MIICRANCVAKVDFAGFNESIILAMFVDNNGSGVLKLPIKMSDELRQVIESRRINIVKKTQPRWKKFFHFLER